MNISKTLGISLCFLSIFSCDFMVIDGELKKLDEKRISNKNIEISWYKTSSITTIHEHVEITKGKTIKKIAELNKGGIMRIQIKSDTILIETKENGLFYRLDKEVFNYKVVLDTIE